MTKSWLKVLLLAGLCGCASWKALQKTDDILSETLSRPRNFETSEVQSRYWSSGNFLIHFITNVNDKNKHLAPIIYVHGLGGSLDGFSEIIKRIHYSASSLPYYAIDLAPFGRSVVREPDVSIREYSEMFEKFISMLSVPKVSLVCHSMGGQVCMYFALAYPNQINLLTLVSPAGVYERAAFIDEVTRHYTGINIGSIDYPQASTISSLFWYDSKFTRRMITDNPQVLVGIESFRENFHERIKNLKTKTLILWGREDKLFSYENGLFLKENVENSVLYVIDGAGHTPFKTHADLISKIILNSL